MHSQMSVPVGLSQICKVSRVKGRPPRPSSHTWLHLRLAKPKGHWLQCAQSLPRARGAPTLISTWHKCMQRKERHLEEAWQDKSRTEVNFLVQKLCRNNEKIPFQTKISYLQKWANWPAQAGSKKWAENPENCRMKRKFPISKKIAELMTKKLTSECKWRMERTTY